MKEIIVNGTELSEGLEELALFIYLFIYLFWPHSMWDLNSLVRDQTYTPAAEVQSLNR